ncbi:hypothetical protein [Pseudoneobacillus sp. C159]
MIFKGKFNQKGSKENNITNMNEFEKQILRINALEVQIKSLMEFEKQYRSSIVKNEVKKEPLRTDRIAGRHEPKYVPTPKDEKRLGEPEIRAMIESVLTEKMAAFIQSEKSNEERMANLIRKERTHEEKIKALESDLSRLQIEMEQMNYGLASSSYPDESAQEVLLSQINLRVSALEANYLLVNEVQAHLLKRLDDLIEKCEALMKVKNGPVESVKQTDESIIQSKESLPLKGADHGNVFIEKLYLEKYEQNNNFAQLGIKDLSGALNIGATYGTVPKKMTSQAKAELEKMKTEMERIKNDHTQNDPSAPNKPQQNPDKIADTPTQSYSVPPEDELTFVDIKIED